MHRRLTALALLGAFAALAACHPSFEAQMVGLDRLVHRTTYDAWSVLAANDAALGRRLYPWLDWSTDGCSAPLVGGGPFDFTVPCTRHDLAWRNLRRVGQRFDRDVWNAANKQEADRRFRDDLRTRCSRLPRVVLVTCLATAEVYGSIVRLVPPFPSRWTRATGHFRW
jgi:hypothetical protein